MALTGTVQLLFDPSPKGLAGIGWAVSRSGPANLASCGGDQSLPHLQTPRGRHGYFRIRTPFGIGQTPEGLGTPFAFVPMPFLILRFWCPNASHQSTARRRHSFEWLHCIATPAQARGLMGVFLLPSSFLYY